MDTRFVAPPATDDQVSKLGVLQPANPFATPGYFAFRRSAGYEPWVLGLSADGTELLAGCGAFLKRGKLNRTLEIPSLPAVPADSPFWQGVRDFCRGHGVTKLELGTFASPPGVQIPQLGSRSSQTTRCEFVIDLAVVPAPVQSQSHRKNIRRAQRAGLFVRRSTSAEAANAHLALMDQSMDRRRSRGESVSSVEAAHHLSELLRTGAAELFQALRDDTVLSSVLVLRAAKGGYSYYAGTSPEGMKASASHFLNDAIAGMLRSEGAEVYNLGGADEGSTLASFKDGFGARRVHLLAAHCYVGPPWRRRIGRALELVRSDRPALVRAVAGRVSRLKVYAADPSRFPPPGTQPGLTFRALTPDEIRELPVDDLSFRSRQLDRLARFEGSYAYGVYADGRIAHVSWLLPQTAMQRDVPRVVKADAYAAEITGCETLPEFRGRGIYGVAIHNLMDVARAHGVRRVFMKTSVDNKSSQAGIAKAGLAPIGSATVIELPLTERTVVWRRFR